MPQNPIQFQPGMSLSELMERFGTEAQCEAALEKARWFSGFVCLECGEHKGNFKTAARGTYHHINVHKYFRLSLLRSPGKVLHISGT